MTARRDLHRAWVRVGVALVVLMAWPVAAQRVVIISSAQTEPYRLAAGGITKLGAAVEVFHVGVDQETAMAASLARSGRDTAIVALGGAAASLVANARLPSPHVPVVNCMVIAASAVRSGNATNVPVEIPVETQAAWLRRLLPQARTVGILYDPAQDEAATTEAAAALKRAGFAVVMERVADPAALTAALKRIQHQVDVLHALPDSAVYKSEHVRSLLLFSFRHQVPLVGPTESWVRAGALFALDWDYQDLGRYCGALALRQVAGGKAPMPSAPRTRVIANARSAEQLRIHWDDETRRLIDPLY